MRLGNPRRRSSSTDAVPNSSRRSQSRLFGPPVRAERLKERTAGLAGGALYFRKVEILEAISD
jgi:hypothetical protein